MSTPHDPPSVFDEPPEPSPTPEPQSVTLPRYVSAPEELNQEKGIGLTNTAKKPFINQFIIGVLLVLVGHLIAGILVVTPVMAQHPKGYDLLSSTAIWQILGAIGMIIVLFQWFYVVPLFIFALIWGTLGRGGKLLLGVVVAAAISVLMLIPICGVCSQVKP